MLREKQTRIVKDLVKGKEYANQLKALLNKPFEDEGLVLAEQLANEVLKSFTNSLAVVSKSSSGSSSTTDEISQIESGCGGGGGGGGTAAADQLFSTAVSSGDLSFQGFDRCKKKDQRGVYKRRRAAESWVIVSPTTKDGYAWRKYGQKGINNSDYPRCYFRCTHKYDQGCKATKQVQKINQQQTIVHKTTYFGHHTCKDIKKTSLIISDPEYEMDSNLLSFQGPIPTKNHVHPRSYNNIKYESKEETESDLTESSILKNKVGSAGSSEVAVGMDLSPKMGCFHEEAVSSVFSSAAAASTTSLHGLDMKIFTNFGDINNYDFTFEDNNVFL